MSSLCLHLTWHEYLPLSPPPVLLLVSIFGLGPKPKWRMTNFKNLNLLTPTNIPLLHFFHPCQRSGVKDWHIFYGDTIHSTAMENGVSKSPAFPIFFCLLSGQINLSCIISLCTCVSRIWFPHMLYTWFLTSRQNFTRQLKRYERHWEHGGCRIKCLRSYLAT